MVVPHAKLDVGDRCGIFAAAGRVLVIVENVNVEPRAVAERVDECIDRPVTGAGDLAFAAVDSQPRGQALHRVVGRGVLSAVVDIRHRLREADVLALECRVNLRR